MVHFFTGLPTSAQRDRQANALASLRLGPVRTTFIDKRERLGVQRFTAGDLVVYDTTWARHETFKVLAAEARSAGARIVAGRFTPGRIAHDVSEQLRGRSAT